MLSGNILQILRAYVLCAKCFYTLIILIFPFKEILLLLILLIPLY